MKNLFKYNYGQTVRIITSAPAFLGPGICVDVVGMTTLDHARKLFDTHYPVGTVFYLVEYVNGSSLEVPEEYIESVG